MAGESNISLGGIAARAEKLEAENKVAETPETKEPEVVEPAAETETKPVANTPGQAPVAKAPEPEKKAPNDPDELRKWNTKVSMELSDVKKQLEVMAAALQKSTRKTVDWKDLAKDPAKLQAAVEEAQKTAAAEATEQYEPKIVAAYRDLTASEKERRLHDPKYPRWGELLPKMISMAASADRRVNFDEHPKTVLDQMYDLAVNDNPNAAAPVSTAPAAKSYTEAELATAKEEARKEALAEAQKGLAAEAKGAGVGGMGKGAPKGSSDGAVKKAAWSMPLSDLKAAIQQASDK